MFRGKNYKESAKLIDKQALYDPMEALKLVISASKAKFDETVELHVKLGVDGRHADQQVRGAIVLPNGTGKTKALRKANTPVLCLWGKRAGGFWRSMPLLCSPYVVCP